jgi:sugar diacid utilization regulator
MSKKMELTPLDKEIIRGLADYNMKPGDVARALYVHPNTVDYHVDRIKRITGLNAKAFHDLVELLERIEADDETD